MIGLLVGGVFVISRLDLGAFGKTTTTPPTTTTTTPTTTTPTSGFESCDENTKMCKCYGGPAFEMGATRTCNDCRTQCGGGTPTTPANTATCQQRTGQSCTCPSCNNGGGCSGIITGAPGSAPGKCYCKCTSGNCEEREGDSCTCDSCCDGDGCSGSITGEDASTAGKCVCRCNGPCDGSSSNDNDEPGGDFTGRSTGPGTRSQDPLTRKINQCAGLTGQTYLSCVNSYTRIVSNQAYRTYMSNQAYSRGSGDEGSYGGDEAGMQPVRNRIPVTNDGVYLAPEEIYVSRLMQQRAYQARMNSPVSVGHHVSTVKKGNFAREDASTRNSLPLMLMPLGIRPRERRVNRAVRLA